MVRFTANDGVWFVCRCGAEKCTVTAGAAAEMNDAHACGQELKAPPKRAGRSEPRRPVVRRLPAAPPVLCQVCFTEKSTAGACLC